MKTLHPVVTAIGIIFLALLTTTPASAQWAAEPGSTVRNVFGPAAGKDGNQCRGACGGGCPKSCARDTAYECADSAQLRRIEIYACDTHPGCRSHDDCLDTCAEFNSDSADCPQQCDAKVMEDYGVESSAGWLTGNGPSDGKINFEYTREAPGAPEPAYRCPTGTTRQCSGNAGCVDAQGTAVEPVFDSYTGGQGGGMRISQLVAGPACGDKVCAQSATISVTGADTCPGGQCTRYGMEFDYQNADPSAPLECSTSTSGGDSDFIGDLLKQGADAAESRGMNTGGANQGDDGMGQLLGMFGKVLASGDSPEDIDISMAPLGEDGKPIESQRVGSTPNNGPPPVPRSIVIPAASGHLFVPMYQLAGDPNTSGSKQRKISCTHKGQPVLETVFQLNM